MPFADFLATVGAGTQAGRAGEYFGGQTPGQRRVDMFVNDQLPKLAQEIERANNRQDIERSARGLLTSGLQAGLQPAALDKLMDMVVQPALRNVQGNELESIRRDYGPQTTPLTPQVAPEGQGQPLSPQTTFAPQTTPERPLDATGVRRYFEATGAKPETFQSIMATPSVIGENVAQARGHAATAAGKEYELSQQRRLENIQLPGSAGEAGMTAGMLATPHAAPLGSYMTGLNPQRERPADPLEEEKRQHLIALTERATRSPAEPRAPRGSTEMQDYLAQGGNPKDQNAFLDYIERRRGRESQTVADVPMSALDTEVALKGIMDEAVRTKKTSPEQIKAIAAKRGLVLEGTPQIESTGGILGLGAEKSLAGEGVTLRRAPRVTTRTPGSAQPRGTAPTGQPPAGAAPAQGGTVLMRAPDGSQRQVPADRVEEFKKRGATVVGGR